MVFHDRRSDDNLPIPEEIVQAYALAIKSVIRSTRARMQNDGAYESKTNGIFIPKTTRLDAYYKIPIIYGVMNLVSIGKLTENTSSGLFVVIHAKTLENDLVQLVNIQTPKDPELLDKSDIHRLRGFHIEQLQRLNSTIHNAQPIEREEYDKFMGPFQAIIPVAEF